MRHLREGRKLSRTAAHRRSLLRNLATALFEHERIETTLEKAKEARRVAERMITYAKRGSLHSRRLVARTVRDPLVVQKLFDTIAPWYAERPGGYTRILRTRTRLGDAGEMAILELVKTPEQRAADARAREKAQKESEKAEKKGEKKAEKKSEKESAKRTGRADAARRSTVRTEKVPGATKRARGRTKTGGGE